MIRRLGRGLAAAALVVALAGVAAAENPRTPADARGFDKTVRDTLAEVHNAGADLYNVSKDYAGAYRLYEGALRTVRPLLAHRPATRGVIDGALADADKEPDVARRAFLLHEAIEKVRGELKAQPPATGKTDEPKAVETPKKPVEPPKKTDKTDEPKKVDEPKKKTDEPKKTNPFSPPSKTDEPKKKVDEPKKPVTPPTKTEEPKKKPVEPKKTTPLDPDETPLVKPKTDPDAKPTGNVKGTVTYKGKPVGGADITFTPADAKGTKVVRLSDDDGAYSAKALPPGEYAVTVTGAESAKLPAKFGKADTSPLRVEIKAGSNSFDIELK